MKIILFIALGLYYLCLGSFCNVLIYRTMKKEQFVKGRSYCPNCHHQLAWFDNIPLLSWLSLGGKCRYCKEPISKQYPIVEFTTCMLGLLLAYRLYATTNLLEKPYLLIEYFIYGIVVLMLVALSVIDFKTLEIPMYCNITLFVCGVVITIIEGDYINHIIGMISVSFFLFLVFFITNGRGIGFGDVKLMFAVGLIIGWKAVVIGFFMGCILAIIIHPIRMKISKESNMLAFGPYLSLGAYIGVFVGEFVINGYINFLESLMK